MRGRTAPLVLSLVLGPVLIGCAETGSQDEGGSESVTGGSSVAASQGAAILDHLESLPTDR